MPFPPHTGPGQGWLAIIWSFGFFFEKGIAYQSQWEWWLPKSSFCSPAPHLPRANDVAVISLSPIGKAACRFLFVSLTSSSIWHKILRKHILNVEVWYAWWAARWKSKRHILFLSQRIQCRSRNLVNFQPCGQDLSSIIHSLHVNRACTTCQLLVVLCKM